MAKRPGPDGKIYGSNDFAPQENLMLTDRLAVQLGQVNCDVQDQLVNNDYEKKFFEWGDTVKIVAINPNSVKVEARNFKSSVRPMLNDLEFAMTTMVIDKSLAYGFKIDDLTKIEELWNRESALTDLAARKMRETHNLKTLDLILRNVDVPCIGRTTPINIFSDGEKDLNPAEQLFKIVNAIQMQMERAGATDRNGVYTYGSNQTGELRTNAGLFLAPELKLELLNAQYTRIDDVTEAVIRDGKYEKFGGFILNQANELSTASAVHCEALDEIKATMLAASKLSAGDELAAIVVGTKNLVTRASRVLPIEKIRSEVERATKYDCMEIYGEMVAVPQAGVIVFCKIPAGKIINFGGYYRNDITDPAATTLLPQYRETRPYVEVPANGNVNMPQPYASIGRPVGSDKKFADNTGYAQFDVPGEFVTEGELQTALGGYVPATRKVNNKTLDADVTLGAGDVGAATNTHIHTFDVTGDAQTDVKTSGPAEPADDENT